MMNKISENMSTGFCKGKLKANQSDNLNIFQYHKAQS